MMSRKLRIPIRCFVLALALIGLVVLGRPALSAPPGDFLFIDSNKQGDSSNVPLRAVIRNRSVDVNWDVLSRSTTPSTPLALNLFDDVSLSAVLDRVEPNSNGWVWVGHVPDAKYSSVVLSVVDGVMQGNISTLDAHYQVRYTGNGTHVIQKLDDSKFPPEAEPIPVDTHTLMPTFMASPSLVTTTIFLPFIAKSSGPSGTTIDVMVVYTPNAVFYAGGASAMTALINLAVTETNDSYLNSGVNQRLNLVYSAQVTYTESGNFSTDLNRVTGTSDGYMDGVHAWRNTYHADETVLLTGNGPSSPLCGIAWLMTTVSTAFAPNAFAVVEQSCATGYYSFGHELGHNMGAGHDRYVNAGPTPYPYAYGYVNTAARWRTVMAYNDQCSASGFSCTRLKYWSNPDVLYGGAPTGVAEGSANAADNRKTLNNTAATVASFR